MSGKTPLDRAYEFITEDDDRSCLAIPEEACQEVPRNFFLNTGNGALTKLAEQIASPGLVLPWLLASIGAPTAIAGWLIPIKDSGSLLPQLIVSSRIRTYAVRKWFWVAAGIVQSAALALMIPAAALLPPTAAGVAILILLGIFSIASGIGSIAFKEVMAKTIPKGRRGRLLALRSTIGGVLTLGAGLLLRLFVQDDADAGVFLLLVTIASLLWFGAALIFAIMIEPPGATQGGRNAIAEARNGLHLLRASRGLRRFLYARALLLSIPLALPFYALLARDLPGATIGSLGIFIIANAFSQIVASPVWGRFADASARLVMAASGLLAMLASCGAIAITLLPDDWQNAWTFSPLLFLLGVAYAGARLGRKTYIIDAAPENERPLYVAVANTSIGLLIFIAGLFGLLAEFAGVRITIGALALCSLLGVIASLAMPEADDFE